MTDIHVRLATGKGKLTPNYPTLGTGPVSYEDSISPEFSEAEQPKIPDSGAAFFSTVTEAAV
jgi:hypothetical protein